ncbi:family 88 glycosyl hydrolase [Crepidotus variabilis]|uniref:Family 88 glycosyl hydrolase n=1 Tax=Crepidotus variabilis TaxID=179855 RepID=A0A9P6EA38_9AGAR|nr:family 88 glycosyl hydrolase [Crepidotus variabilis]
MVNISVVSTIAAAVTDYQTFPFDPGFDIQSILKVTQSLPSHSWEYGTFAEALIEIYNPEISVFGETPFPVPSFAKNDIKALNYLQPKVVLGTGYTSLAKGDGAAGDPASMGVGAVLLGKSLPTFATAAEETVTALLKDTPRFANGAISHRADVAELWADFMYMVPPFFAYYAADKTNETLLREAVKQCGLYRDVLQSKSNDQWNGAWHHIIGPQNQDLGLWSTGNAWAAAGMTRVLATVMKLDWLQSTWKNQAADQLSLYIKQIVDAVVKAPQDGKLLRNYLNDLDQWNGGFGEISGSSLMAATIYRMAVLRPDTFGQSYIRWADEIRQTLGEKDTQGAAHVTPAGVVTPAVNPLAWKDPIPYTAGSPEGNSFAVLLYAAWRDCVLAHKCVSPAPGSSLAPPPATIPRPTTKCPNRRQQVKAKRSLTNRQRDLARRHIGRRGFHINPH